jgi:GNAT superfamily N-acetyltransferase
MISYQVEKWSSAVEEMRPLWEQHYSEIAYDQAEIPFFLNEAFYLAAETSGILLFVTVRDNGKLIGYSKNLLSRHPHHASSLFCFNDSYFILPEYRQGWIGVHLFRYAEDRMREAGVKKAVVSTQDNMDRGSVFKRLRYRKSGAVYTKVLL